MGWQEAAGYGKRSLVETAVGRFKGIIGARLRSRSWAAQKFEAAIGVTVLNRMTQAGSVIYAPLHSWLTFEGNRVDHRIGLKA